MMLLSKSRGSGTKAAARLALINYALTSIQTLNSPAHKVLDHTLFTRPTWRDLTKNSTSCAIAVARVAVSTRRGETRPASPSKGVSSLHQIKSQWRN